MTPKTDTTNTNNLWADVQKARVEINLAVDRLQPLLKTLPPGQVNQAVAGALMHIAAAGVALQFRQPGVPFQLVFITPPLRDARQVS